MDGSVKLSIFTTLSNPGHRQDPWQEALRCYADLADELVVIDGSMTKNGQVIKFLDSLLIGQYTYTHSPWPKEFEWSFIGQQFQKGYEYCSGDWVIRMDLDYFLHHHDFNKIHTILENNPQVPAFSFWKYQFLLVDRYQIKSRPVLAFNKKHFGDRLQLLGGDDLCQPVLDGKLLTPYDVPEMKVPIYNYDFCFKQEDIIKYDFARFCRAWGKTFHSYPFGGPSNDEAIEGFKKMMVGRFASREFAVIALDEHPKYIQDKIRTMEKNRFGYNMFGWIDEKASYYN